MHKRRLSVLRSEKDDRRTHNWINVDMAQWILASGGGKKAQKNVAAKKTDFAVAPKKIS